MFSIVWLIYQETICKIHNNKKLLMMYSYTVTF